ncbi:MAG TPA: single-stranded DNA-binding protein [Alkalispirochaeta sp.]|nr:single-stranded DNA-binding protein [Alkalispirochaeta sp.]
MAQSGINTVVIAGNLVRDAELKYTNNGLAICEFSVAVNDQRKQGDSWVDEAHFFDVTVFGRRGEAIQRYLTKGKTVAIEGKLKQDRWQNQEGQNRSKVGIIANNVMLLGGRDGGSGGSESSGGNRSGGAPSGSGGESSNSSGGFGGDDFPDDIPF